MKKKILFALIALIVGCIAPEITAQVTFHDAAATKPQVSARRSSPSAVPAVQASNSQFLLQAVTTSSTATDSQLQPGKTFPSELRRLNARKAVTAADVPGKVIQLTYGTAGYQYSNPSELKLVGDSIYFINFFGWGTTIKAKVDLNTGAFNIERQMVYMHPTYGQVDIMACDPKASTFDKNGVVPGKIENNTVTIGPWVALIIGGEMENYSIGYGLHTESVFKAANSTLTCVSINPDSTTSTVNYDMLAEQPGTNVVTLYNFANTGGKVDIYIHGDKSMSLAPTQLFANTSGYFFCYKADWDKGELYPGLKITGTTTTRSLDWGNWGIFSSSGKYYYGKYIDGHVTLPFDLQYPPTQADGFVGSGTQEDPYQISTPADLFALSDAVNNATIPSGSKKVSVFEGVYFKQTKTINMKGYLFPPIGGSDDNYRFSGVYDGDNKTISNLTVNTGGRGYAALFGAVDTVGVIKNVTLSSPVISGEYYYAGGVVAYSAGTTENCKVTNGKITGNLIAGGVCGSSGPATKLSFTGTVTGASNVGGVIGNTRFPSTFLSATNTTVNGYGTADTQSVGGVVGYLTSGKTGGYLSDSYFSGYVNIGRAAMFGGGVVGCSVEAEIARCFSIGEIYATGTISQIAAGGIVGAVQGMTLRDCFFGGNMEVPASWSGPLAGYCINVRLEGHPDHSEFINCIVTGRSRSTSSTYDYTPYLGWFDTRTQGSAPTITNCRTDASTMPRLSAAKGFTSLDSLTNGEALPGFDANVWSFAQGFYPTIKTIPANTAANVAKAPIRFSGKDNVENVSANFELPTTNSVKWQVYNNGKLGTAGHGIIISGSTASLNGSIATDTIVASNGTFRKWYIIRLAPESMFEGSGTEEDPYLIRNKADLMKLGEATTNNLLTFDGSYFAITADIDMGGDASFLGISNCSSSTYKFGGILDGRNHTISGLNMQFCRLNEDGFIADDAKISNRGFIGRMKDGGAVKNLRFAADCIFVFYSSSGAFVGDCYGDVINCRNYAPVIAHAGTSGAIVGYARAGSHILDCYNAGSMTGGYHYVGGIAGYNYGLIQNCRNDGDVACKVISKNYNDSKLSGAGGIVNANFGDVRDCINTGAITVPQYAGGIVAWFNTTSVDYMAENCINLGIVSGKTYMGEMVGRLYKDKGLRNCYWDAQLSLIDACESKPHEGAKGLTTAQLTSGDPIEGLEATYWQFKKGEYPSLKSFADEPMAIAASRTVVDFGASQHRQAIKHDATLAAAEGLKWQLSGAPTPFAVNGNTLEMRADSVLHTDTLVAISGNYIKRIPLVSTPDTLQAPQIAKELTADKSQWSITFSNIVGGVQYLYTINGDDPTGNTALTSNGSLLLATPDGCTLRVIARHRNYFDSPEVSEYLASTGDVNALDLDKQIESRIYINQAGISSPKPFDGVNIIITVYTDGTRTVEKCTLRP